MYRVVCNFMHQLIVSRVSRRRALVCRPALIFRVEPRQAGRNNGFALRLLFYAHLLWKMCSSK